MNTLQQIKPETNVGILLIVCCIICSFLTFASTFCPENQRLTCLNIAGVINCLICIYVILKMFKVI